MKNVMTLTSPRQYFMASCPNWYKAHCFYCFSCSALIGYDVIVTLYTKINLRFIDEYVANRITFRDKYLVLEKLVGIVESQRHSTSKEA